MLQPVRSLNAVAEDKEQDVRVEAIRSCHAVLPERGAKFPDVIPTVHHLGKLRKHVSKPQRIIIQFSMPF